MSILSNFEPNEILAMKALFALPGMAYWKRAEGAIPAPVCWSKLSSLDLSLEGLPRVPDTYTLKHYASVWVHLVDVLGSQLEDPEEVQAQFLTELFSWKEREMPVFCHPAVPSVTGTAGDWAATKDTPLPSVWDNVDSSLWKDSVKDCVLPKGFVQSRAYEQNTSQYLTTPSLENEIARAVQEHGSHPGAPAMQEYLDSLYGILNSRHEGEEATLIPLFDAAKTKRELDDAVTWWNQRVPHGLTSFARAAYDRNLATIKDREAAEDAEILGGLKSSTRIATAV